MIEEVGLVLISGIVLYFIMEGIANIILAILNKKHKGD